MLPLDLLFARPLKEKRLMRRREKLPDFFLGAEAVLALGKSSCDWLRPASFCLFFLRKISLVPLRRKPTARGGGDGEPALLACLALGTKPSSCWLEND